MGISIAKRIKEIRRIVKQEHCNTLDLIQANGGHFQLLIQNPAGQSKKIHCSQSPSCSNALKNFRADVRRFAKQTNER